MREIQVRESDVMFVVILAMWLRHAQWQIVLGGREIVRETDRGFAAAAPLDPGNNGGLYRARDRSVEYFHDKGR